ncbi:hypothetical protein JCM18899A_07930 [Nocardioides sp. AN3]
MSGGELWRRVGDEGRAPETADRPEQVHAFREDYRAGATTDPVLVIWGEKFLGAAPELPDSIWRRTFAPHAEGVEVPGGHFNAEEAPGETLAALENFLGVHAR